MTGLLIGADPEVFVLDAQGRNVSGHDMIPGTKKKPHVVPRGAIQVDGTALEFNIKPAESEIDFVLSCKAVLKELRDRIPKDHRLDMSAVVEYEEKYFESLPKYARRLGCSPDYDAYTGYEMCRPDSEQTMRTAAGHLHLGWGKDMSPFERKHFQSCRTITKELDASLGLASVLFDQEGQMRRTLYGQAGAFRPKPYGVEYRVLSNSWLKNDELMAWVYQQARAAFDRLCSRSFWFHKAINEKVLQEIINTGDKKEALRNIDSFAMEHPPGFKAPKPKKEDGSGLKMYKKPKYMPTTQWVTFDEVWNSGIVPNPAPIPAPDSDTSGE